ncbi:hypothetical protein [Burkholderia cepacia]|nr:hypothetical protein [Burkholderia cepacia]
MKRLYARLVLWLIRPALADVERRLLAKIEIEGASRINGDAVLHALIERQ